MPSAHNSGFLVLLLTAGCAATGCVGPRESQRAGTTPGGAVESPATATRSRTATAKPEVPLEKPPVSGSAGQELTRTEATAAKAGEPVPTAETPLPKPEVLRPKAEVPAPRTEAPAAKTVTPAPKVEAPAAKTAAKAPLNSAPAEKAAKSRVAAPAPAKPPMLDLDLLEQRLKETEAIGVFTKLTLKNQVDDLLNRFRAHYQGRAKTTLAELRQPYDLLILKVLALLQDGDPSLARTIADSREAIWSILADPVRFQGVTR